MHVLLKVHCKLFCLKQLNSRNREYMYKCMFFHPYCQVSYGICLNLFVLNLRISHERHRIYHKMKNIKARVHIIKN